MDLSEEFNKVVTNGLNVVNSNRIFSTVLGLFLALYAALAAPALPSFMTDLLKSPWIKLIFMFFIALLATKDPSVAIISAVALLVTLQTLHNQETN